MDENFRNTYSLKQSKAFCFTGVFLTFFQDMNDLEHKQNYAIKYSELHKHRFLFYIESYIQEHQTVKPRKLKHT